MNVLYNILISVILLFFPTCIPSRKKLHRFIIYSVLLSISLSITCNDITPVNRWILHCTIQLILGSIQVCRFKQYPKLYARLSDYRIHSGPLYYYVAAVQAIECIDASCPIQSISMLTLFLVFIAVLFRPKPNTLRRRQIHGICMCVSYLTVSIQLCVLYNYSYVSLHNDVEGNRACTNGSY